MTFDEKVCETVFHCLGMKPSPEAADQAVVSTTIGGLGIRRIVDHAKGAFSASWHEAQIITKETWWTKGSDDDCSAEYVHQQKASSIVDVAIMTNLKSKAENARETQRLNRLDYPHANAWLSARPSHTDGKDTVLKSSAPLLPSPRSTRVL